MDKPTFKEESLNYHIEGKPGKLEVRATTPLETQADLSMAYSPGVAHACEYIVEDPLNASKVTARGNLVAVISNGTAVLGLGAIGALASKPVMEGKAVLMKKFSDIDTFDLEIDETDPEKLVNIIAALEPTFGGIVLEDIKAPDCFIIEQRLRELMDIPVFHDDQHGTAIIAVAGLINALHLTGRDIKDTRIVCNGAGAAGIACIELAKALGVPHDNVILCDAKGVIYKGRAEGMNQWKSAHAVETDARSLYDALKGADVFLGVSVKGALTEDMLKVMAPNPVIFAMANPDPEITPEEAHGIRDDAIVATGRSDYPNQVNNVLGFPYIFRGALDVQATEINDAMKIGCIEGIAALARATTSAEAAAAYKGEHLTFGPDYLIPKPFDPRLVGVVASAVAKAAMESGVATRPITDMAAYKAALDQSVFKSALLMRPVFDAARTSRRRIVFAEGEDERVLRAAQAMIEETGDAPILIGRPGVVEDRCETHGLTIRAGQDFQLATQRIY